MANANPDPLRPAGAQGDYWPDQPPPRRTTSGGCLRACLVVFLVGIVLTIILGAGIAYVGYRFVKEGIERDPAKIEAMLQTMLPSTMPPGYEAKIGFHLLGTTTVFIAPDEPDRHDPDPRADETDFEGTARKKTIFIVFAAPALDLNQLRESFESSMRRQGKKADRQNAKSEPVQVNVGGVAKEAKRSTWTQDGQGMISYDLVPKPGVLFVAMGPQGDFDQASMDAFLASVRAAEAAPKPPAAKESTAKESATKEPIAKEPAAKESAAKGSATSQPAVKEPAAKDSPSSTTKPSPTGSPSKSDEPK